MRHFRIAHYAESADDGAVVVAYIAQHNVWDCQRCGVENDNRAFCWQCSAERGDWVCPCTHRNKKRSHECEVCGEPKPEDME